MISDYLSSISVLLVFIIMFNEHLNKTYEIIVNDKPHQTKVAEFARYKSALKSLRFKFISVSLFELATLATIIYTLTLSFESLNPIFVLGILIILAISVLVISALWKLLLIQRKLNLNPNFHIRDR